MTEFRFAQLENVIDNLPPSMARLKKFFPCKIELDGAKIKKLPLRVGWNKSENQSTLQELQAATFVGFCISGGAAEFLFLDFDHVLKDGVFVNNEVAEFVAKLQATFPQIYIERSISKTGLHAFLCPTAGRFPAVANSEGQGVLHFGTDKDAKLELFYRTAGRFCLMTGDRFSSGDDIPTGAAVDKFFLELHFRIVSEHKARQPPPTPIISARPVKNYSRDLDYEDARARAIFESFPVAQLTTDTDWLEFISAAKGLGIPYSDIDRKNLEDMAKYDARENLKRYESITNSTFGVGNLYKLALRYGSWSKERDKQFWRDWHGHNSKKVRRF